MVEEDENVDYPTDYPDQKSIGKNKETFFGLGQYLKELDKGPDSRAQNNPNNPGSGGSPAEYDYGYGSDGPAAEPTDGDYGYGSSEPSEYTLDEPLSDWRVPDAHIETPPANPLEDLLDIASREAELLRSEGIEMPRERIFRPPNSPRKNTVDYLKELAGSEAYGFQTAQRNFRREAHRELLNRRVQKTLARRTPEESRALAEARPDAPYSRAINPDVVYDKEVRSFNDFDENIFHMNPRSKMYVCAAPGCSKEFPSLSRIKRHYIIHTSIKPFKCLNKQCNRTFSRKDNMLQHYRVHCPYSQFGS